MNNGSFLSLDSVSKRFGDSHIIEDLSLSVGQGEFVSLLGPSGCGKTTTLRLIAGFEEVSSGSVWLDGVDVTRRPPHKRDVSTVFQSYALFPHMTIRENIAFGPKLKRYSKARVAEITESMLELVNLSDRADRYPRQLSGGQRQRVALARSLANEPKVLLLDEPLGALDLQLRKSMQLEFRRLHKELGLTFIYVTHDQEEALIMSDRIVVMDSGKIQQVGTGLQVYAQPRTRFVADFVGSGNILGCRYQGRNNQNLELSLGGQTIQGHAVGSMNHAVGAEVLTVVRPENICLSLGSHDCDERNAIRAVLEDVIFAGGQSIALCRLADGQLLDVRGNGSRQQLGSDSRDTEVFLSWEHSDTWVLGPRSA